MVIEAEVRGFERCAAVALLATIAPRRAGKLSLVLVLVAIDALGEFDFEFCVFAGGRVARIAFHAGMRKRERETGFGVIGDGEYRGAPTLHGMAAFAASSIGALRKLTLMLVFVAVGAYRMRNGCFEVAVFMTAHAGHVDVLALQGEFCFGVVEGCSEARFLPGCCGVA